MVNAFSFLGGVGGLAGGDVSAGTVTVTIKGQDQYSHELKRAGQSVDDFDKRTAKASRSIERSFGRQGGAVGRFGSAFGGTFGRIIIALGLAGIAFSRFTKSSIKAFADMNTEVLKTRKIFGDNIDAMVESQKQLRNAISQTKSSWEEFKVSFGASIAPTVGGALTNLASGLRYGVARQQATREIGLQSFRGPQMFQQLKEYRLSREERARELFEGGKSQPLGFVEGSERLLQIETELLNIRKQAVEQGVLTEQSIRIINQLEGERVEVLGRVAQTTSLDISALAALTQARAAEIVAKQQTTAITAAEIEQAKDLAIQILELSQAQERGILTVSEYAVRQSVLNSVLDAAPAKIEAMARSLSKAFSLEQLRSGGGGGGAFTGGIAGTSVISVPSGATVSRDASGRVIISGVGGLSGSALFSTPGAAIGAMLPAFSLSPGNLYSATGFYSTGIGPTVGNSIGIQSSSLSGSIRGFQFGGNILTPQLAAVHPGEAIFTKEQVQQLTKMFGGDVNQLIRLPVSLGLTQDASLLPGQTGRGKNSVNPLESLAFTQMLASNEVSGPFGSIRPFSLGSTGFGDVPVLMNPVEALQRRILMTQNMLGVLGGNISRQSPDVIRAIAGVGQDFGGGISPDTYFKARGLLPPRQSKAGWRVVNWVRRAFARYLPGGEAEGQLRINSNFDIQTDAAGNPLSRRALNAGLGRLAERLRNPHENPLTELGAIANQAYSRKIASDLNKFLKLHGTGVPVSMVGGQVAGRLTRDTPTFNRKTGTGAFGMTSAGMGSFAKKYHILRSGQIYGKKPKYGRLRDVINTRNILKELNSQIIGSAFSFPHEFIGLGKRGLSRGGIHEQQLFDSQQAEAFIRDITGGGGQALPTINIFANDARDVARRVSELFSSYTRVRASI